MTNKEENIGPQIAGQIAELIKKKKVIAFGVDIPDNQYGEICWFQYGLIETNEIAVMVRCGHKAFAAKAPSRLIIPAMANRVWGMDALDEALAFELGDKLWTSFSDELVKEVQLLRKSNK